MATTATTPGGIAQGKSNRDLVAAKLGQRHRAEATFKAVGLGAILIGISLVGILFGSILYKGVPAFWQATLHLELTFDPEVIDIDPRPTQQPGQSAADFHKELIAWQRALRRADWDNLIQNAIAKFIPAAGAEDMRRAAFGLVASNERVKLWEMVEANPDIIGQTVPVALVASENVDVWLKGNIDRDLPQRFQQLAAEQQQWADELYEDGVIEMNFASSMFTNVDSRSSGATAGLLGAIVGSVMMMVIVMAVAVPVGVMAAIYLEEFAPKNRVTDLIEVNINNLAAVPSIVFGLLGAAVFINFLGLPLSAPLVGGLVLSLMTLPTVIIASRAALRAVPPSIRQAALGIGASPTQAMFHHTLPLAVPGMLTGAIIGVAQALGETAPLLLIGMNAFVASVPSTPLDQSSALPVQIYLWQGNENRNFFEARTSAAILVLLAVMVTLNALAILMRHRFERRW
ncbi:phosphate ABC transporter permease PstA [Acuticoccus sp. I52.16.1]|uniref:phosphate ABC transporter permease PstA n=1 Tax=Acuticoccus sp. I52.16.1 TaxID=2928472 RepID=UPI001FD49ABD|nr:phosphate ABC transporter permease PstA [Acuticoccus sp. I52.16.1]UOM32758.1 phosphate ABC transporter permease PstA [Acuticoccus sp. I52.16.1]